MSLNSIKMSSAFLVSGFLVSGAAFAADEITSSAPSYRLGGGLLYPGIGVVVKSDSNILRSADNSPAKKSSTVTVLSPSLVYRAQKDANTYTVAYVADVGRFSSSTADNFVDHKFMAEADLELSMRSSLNIKPVYQAGHDDRGATFGGLTLNPNKWTDSGIMASYTYGAEEAMGRFVLDLGYNDRQYQNNRTLTVAYDRKLTATGGTLYMKVKPKTSVLLHVKNTGINYAQATSMLDGNEQRYMLGLKWEATAQSTGEFKVGRMVKKFDNTALQSYSGASWEGALRWSPVTFVKLDVVSSRQAAETTLTGSRAIMISNTGANLAYDVNSRVTLHVNGYQMMEDFVGAGRLDNTNTYGVKAEYKFRDWLIGGAEYTSASKISNVAGNDYKRNIFMLSMRTAI